MPYRMISDISNRTEFTALVISELRNSYGIKYRKDKKHKNGPDKESAKKIFNTTLEQLELTDVILANGNIVKVPVFVSDACQRILDNVKTEGLFRKAGSAARQREIRNYLENGIRLGKAHHVIDVANILKLFFRELPEPILPPGNIQETVLRCLINDKTNEHKVNALMTCCLLLSPLSLNTLSFFMQFLNTVSLHSDVNKMTVENLAIIFAPGLMPLSEMIGQRLNYHVKSIQLLIENAFDIGTIPKSIADKINQWNVNSKPLVDSIIVLPEQETDKKKKKRRSGSLTRMFNGLRKIVLGSSENLDKTLDDSLLSKEPITPFLSKSSKRKKMLESSNGFSAKKKKEVLSFLPENSAVLPNTPLAPREFKKNRLSLGGKRNATKTSAQYASSTSIPPMDRRWSVVGAGWGKKKHNLCDASNKTQQTKPLSPVVSLPCLQSSQDDEKLIITIDTNQHLMKHNKNESFISDSDDFVRIPKSEYEAIKERVSAIETRISQEFSNVHASFVNNRDELNDDDDDDSHHRTNGPINVLDKYEQTLENTEELTNSASKTDQLAKRFGRELKIRQSFDNKIIRSPSARKIGTMRRRSRENIRLSRNQSWHLGATTMSTKPSTVISSMNIVLQNDSYGLESSICPKTNLKRGRPNTVQTGLRYPSPTRKIPFNNDLIATADTAVATDIDMKDEKWINAENFFDSSPMKNKSAPISVNEMKTPMLPPKLPLRKTPLHAIKTPLNSERLPIIKSVLTPLQQDHQTGRASIARLRSQNAGMVAAKAKLFGGMVTEPVADSTRHNSRRESTRFSNKFSIPTNQQNIAIIHTNPLVENIKKQHRYRCNNNKSPNHKSSPRRERKIDKHTNGVQRRQKIRQMKSPAKNSPAKLQNRINVGDASNKQKIKGNQLNANNMHAIIHETCTPDKKMNKMIIDSTPQIKRALIIKSPRRLLKTPCHDNNFHKRKSPIRATPIKLRHSPRLQLHGNTMGH